LAWTEARFIGPGLALPGLTFHLVAAKVAKRNSEYRRIDADTYVSPSWCWQQLYSVEPWAARAWDCCPACAQFDFLEMTKNPYAGDTATNPPYDRLAEKIIRHALALTQPSDYREKREERNKSDARLKKSRALT
jgi:hypothetical protein